VKEFWIYTLARFALFFGTWGLVVAVWALVTDGEVPLFWPLLIGAVLSMALSTFLLRGLRESFVAKVQSRAEGQALRHQPNDEAERDPE
jgi:hypothetical protein